MADENKDIAVLGFQIQSKDAVEAINGIISALDGVSEKAESVDQALEDKVTKALKAMSSAATALGKEETIAGLERTVTALKGLSDASTAFSSFIDNSADIKKGVALLNKVNLGSILEGYSSAIKNTGNEFSKLNPILKDAVKGFSDALSIPDTDKRAQAMGKVSESLRGLYQTLNEYTGEKPAKILPKGILEGDVKDTALKVDTLRGYLDEYVSVLTRVNEVSGKSRHDMQQYNPDEWAKQNQADLAKAKDNAIAVMTDIAKTWQNLNPSFSTIRFNIEIANMDVIKRQLHSGIEVKLAVPPAEVDRFNNVATTMEKLAKPVAVTYDTKQANDIKQLLSDITPKFTITESAINSLQRQMDDASQRLAMEVKIVPRVTGDDEAIAQMQKQAAERARDALTAMGIDVHGKKSIEDAIKGDYYGLVNIGKDLEQLYGGDKVNGILGDLFPKQGATSEQMFKSFTESLGEVRRNMEGLLAFKATLDTSEFDAVLDKFKDTLTSVFTPESKQKFTNALVDDLKKTVLKPASITVSPQKIFIDRSESIMQFVQNTLVMPVDGITVSPTTIWVDKSNAEIRLLQVQLVADWQDVIVHPKNIVIDAAYIQNLGAIKYSQSALPVSSKIKILPTAATIDSNAAKEIVGTSKTTIKVSSPIKIDPLPSDEITKMNELVTQIANVDTAYGGLIGTVRTLKDEIVALESAMSKELRSLIKGEQHRVEAKIKDPEKAAAVQAEKVAKQIEEQNKALAEKAKLEERIADVNKAWSEEGVNPNSETLHGNLAQSVMSLYKAEDVASGKIAENLKKQQEEADRVQKTFNATIGSMDQKLKDLTNTIQTESKTLFQNSQAWSDRIMRTANANAALEAFGVTVRGSTIEMQQFDRVVQLNMADPLAKLKAEIGDTNSRLVDLGRTFGIYLTGRTIINYFRQAAESANNFQMEIRRIQSLATDFDFGALRDGLLDIDARFGNVLHNAQALYWAYSSGVRGSEADLVRFTEHMSKVATTIKSDIMPTIDAATSIMNAWNLSAGSAAEIGDTLFGIVKFGKSNAQQLTTSLGHVVAPAAALNVSLDELGATAATLTRTMKTNRAFTYLSNILGKMASPTKAVQEAAAELGVELSANAIKAKGFANVMKEIRQATNGDVSKIAKLFPDLRGQRAAITLLSTQFGDFEQQLENFKHKEGSMEEALGKITDTPEAQIKALKNTMGMLALEVGNTTNNLLTLGGALGPVLEKFNAMGHVGRAVTGNLLASGSALAGMAVASKAMQAAQYAMLQASYQQASVAMELRRNELDIALTKEQQALENNKIALSEMKAKIAADQYNDTVLKNLRAQKDTLAVAVERGKQDLINMRQGMKMADQMAKRELQERAAAVGRGQSRVTALEGELTNLNTNAQHRNLQQDLNLIDRLRSDIAMTNGLLKDQDQVLLQNLQEKIGPLIAKSADIQDALHNAFARGDAEGIERFKAEFQTVVSMIKNTTVISSALSGKERGDDILKVAARQYALDEMRKNIVSGTNYEHQLLISLVKEELDQAKKSVKEEQDRLNRLKQQYASQEEITKQADILVQKEAKANALATTLSDINLAISDRTKELVGDAKEYVAVLSENVKVMKAKLDADTTDASKIKANLELSLKNAAAIGKGTLAATQAVYDAELKRRSILMEQRSVLSEIMGITDAKGRLLSNDEKTQERYNALLKRQAELEQMSLDARKQFAALGSRVGNQDAVSMLLKDWQGPMKLNRIVDKVGLDKRVQSEMIRSMSREVGSRFAIGNGLRMASMGLSFVPGMSNLAMPLSLLSSFDVIGKTAGGMTKLTASMMKLFGVTERFQKKGILSLNTNVATLVKTLMTSSAWTKKMALSEQTLMALRAKGMKANAMASFATTATWATAIGGSALIAAIAGGLWYALSKTEKGGPLGDVAEKIYGIDEKKQYGDYLSTRLEMMKGEQDANASMIREMRRMIDASSNLQDSLITLAEKNRMIEALGNLEKYGNRSTIKMNLDEHKQQLETNQAVLELLRDKVTAVSFEGQMIPISPNKKIIDKVKAEIAELQKQIEKDQKAVDDYPKLLEGIAESRYQQLRELMESDWVSAFMPIRDAQGQLDLSNKMLDMSIARFGKVLSTDKDVVTLVGRSTDQIRELVRVRVGELSDAWENAEQDKKLAELVVKKTKEGSKQREEAEKKLAEAEKNVETARKAYEDFLQNARNAGNDLYSAVNRVADMMVKAVTDKVKTRSENAKYLALFDSVDTSFRTRQENILMLRKTMDDMMKQYTEKSGIFKILNDREGPERFKKQMKELSDQVKANVTANINDIKNTANSLATLMEQLSNDALAAEKSLFDARMNNPAYAGIRNKLINRRFGMLGQIIYGQNGQSGLIAMRNQALEEARRLQGLNDPQGAMKYLSEAQKRQKQIVGLEQQQLDLVKLKADKEKEINQSLYQLANTLRGQFAATSQAAIDVNSVEGIRLRSRRLGENIAPPTAFTAQQREEKFREKIIQQDAKFAQDLAKFSQDFYTQLSAQLKNVDINGAAATMGTAADNMKTASETFERAAKAINTQIKVVRL